MSNKTSVFRKILQSTAPGRLCRLLLACCLIVPFMTGLADAKSKAKPTLFIIGDSTVRNGSKGIGDGGLWGWGKPIENYFDRDRINVENRAMGGTGSRSFLKTLWPPILADMKKGDYLMLQFGHNDNGDFRMGASPMRGSGDETETVTGRNGETETVLTYGGYLQEYVKQAQAKGVTCFICSLVPRNRWTEDGKIVREEFAQWAKEAAEKCGAYFIPLNEITAQKYEQMDEATVKAKYFINDWLHTNWDGAVVNAESVVTGLKGTKSKLKKYLLKGEIHPVDPRGGQY